MTRLERGTRRKNTKEMKTYTADFLFDIPHSAISKLGISASSRLAASTTDEKKRENRIERQHETIWISNRSGRDEGDADLW